MPTYTPPEVAGAKRRVEEDEETVVGGVAKRVRVCGGFVPRVRRASGPRRGKTQGRVRYELLDSVLGKRTGGVLVVEEAVKVRVLDGGRIWFISTEEISCAPVKIIPSQQPSPEPAHITEELTEPEPETKPEEPEACKQNTFSTLTSFRTALTKAKSTLTRLHHRATLRSPRTPRSRSPMTPPDSGSETETDEEAQIAEAARIAEKKKRAKVLVARRKKREVEVEKEKAEETEQSAEESSEDKEEKGENEGEKAEETEQSADETEEDGECGEEQGCKTANEAEEELKSTSSEGDDDTAEPSSTTSSPKKRKSTKDKKRRSHKSKDSKLRRKKSTTTLTPAEPDPIPDIEMAETEELVGADVEVSVTTADENADIELPPPTPGAADADIDIPETIAETETETVKQELVEDPIAEDPASPPAIETEEESKSTNTDIVPADIITPPATPPRTSLNFTSLTTRLTPLAPLKRLSAVLTPFDPRNLSRHAYRDPFPSIREDEEVEEEEKSECTLKVEVGKKACGGEGEVVVGVEKCLEGLRRLLVC